MYQTKTSLVDHLMMVLLGLINNVPWIIGVASADRIVAKFDKPLYLGLINFANFFSGIFARFLSTWLTSKNASYIVQHFVNVIIFLIGFAGLGLGTSFWVVWAAMFVVGFCSTYGESILLCYINYRYKVALMKSLSIGTGLAAFIGAGYSLIVILVDVNYFWSFMGLTPIFLISLFCFWWLHTKSSHDPIDPDHNKMVSMSSDSEKKLVSSRSSDSLVEDPISMWDCKAISASWSLIAHCCATYFFAFVIQTNFAHCSIKAHESEKYYYVYSLLNLMYQIGLLISRSMYVCFKFPHVWTLTIVEAVFFVLWMCQAFLKFMNIYACCVTMFLVGLGCGMSYSNTFDRIMNLEQLSNKHRELATSWNALFYTVGITLSAVWTTITENTFMEEYVTVK